MATAVAAGLTGCQAAFDPAKIPDATPEEVTRVEPLSWWTGMKSRPMPPRVPITWL